MLPGTIIKNLGNYVYFMKRTILNIFYIQFLKTSFQNRSPKIEIEFISCLERFRAKLKNKKKKFHKEKNGRTK